MLTRSQQEAVLKTAKYYYRKTRNLSIELDDLINAGYIGVLSHLNHPNPAAFVKWAILDEIYRWSYKSIPQHNCLAYEIHPELNIDIPRVLSKLTELQEKVVRYRAFGYRQNEIATKLHVSPAYICQILKSLRNKFYQ